MAFLKDDNYNSAVIQNVEQSLVATIDYWQEMKSQNLLLKNHLSLVVSSWLTFTEITDD